MTEPNRTSPTRTLDRRAYLTAAGTAGIALLAGCSGNGNGGGNGNGNGNGNGGDEYLEDEPDYDGWLDSTDNYEGTLDRRDADSITIDVGAGDGLSFSPAAVAVSTDTTITWEWTGEGGGHNVADDGGAFESEETAEAGHTFELTLDEGVYRYTCTPHDAVGMRGVVVVE